LNNLSKLLTAVGVFLALIWSAVTFISFGLPESACTVLKAVTFGVFNGAIDALRNGFFYGAPNKNMPTAVFLSLFSIAFFVYFVVVVRIGKSSANVRSLVLVIMFSILFRLILLPSVAIHESDFYRYLWDGKSFKNGINPFKYAPAEVSSAKAETNQEIKRLKDLRDKNPLYFERINHSGVPTIYPPLAQVVFSASSIIKEDSIFVLKSIFVFFDILALALIVLLLSHFKLNPSLVVVYGWSPLVLKEIANSGHYDSITIFLTLLSLYFLVKNKALAGSISLVCASLTKFYPVLLLPLYIKRIRIRHLLAFAVGVIGMYIPFFIWGHAGTHKVFFGLGIYSQKWAYNGSLFVIIQSFLNVLHFRIFSNFFLTKLITGFIFVMLLLYLVFKRSDEPLGLSRLRRRPRPWAWMNAKEKLLGGMSLNGQTIPVCGMTLDIVKQCQGSIQVPRAWWLCANCPWGVTLKRTLFVLVALFLLNPVGEPWYFCWAIPFLCFFPYRSLILLSWLLIFSYLSFAHDFGTMRVGNLEIPILNAIQYVPFFLFFIWEFVLRKRNALDYVK